MATRGGERESQLRECDESEWRFKRKWKEDGCSSPIVSDCPVPRGLRSAELPNNEH